MNEQPKDAAAQGMQLSDIYYVLFRHKWKILLCSLAGIVAALVVYFVMKPVYQSQAKLFVRYVVESKSISPTANDPQVRSPDSRGDNIINSELEILTSLDLARQVARRLGRGKFWRCGEEAPTRARRLF